MVIQKVPEVVLTQVDELSETSRSGGGFGSTGGFGGK
jgi:dUTPase